MRLLWLRRRRTRSQYKPVATESQLGTEQFVPAEFSTETERGAYRTGFVDGFSAAQSGTVGNNLAKSSKPRRLPERELRAKLQSAGLFPTS